MPYVKPPKPPETQFMTIMHKFRVMNEDFEFVLNPELDVVLEDLINKHGWHIQHFCRLNEYRIVTLMRVLPQDFVPGSEEQRAWFADDQQ